MAMVGDEQLGGGPAGSATPSEAPAAPPTASTTPPGKKVGGRPKASLKRPPQEAMVYHDHLKQKWLKNKESSQDIVQDAIACWTTGGNASDLDQAGRASANMLTSNYLFIFAELHKS